jgi:hypothetical protein
LCATATPMGKPVRIADTPSANSSVNRKLQLGGISPG